MERANIVTRKWGQPEKQSKILCHQQTGEKKKSHTVALTYAIKPPRLR